MRELYRQMVDFPGQVIVSTHSPFVAAHAKLNELRSFFRSGSNSSVNFFPTTLTPHEERKIRREIVENQGEMLFARMLILKEGQTEIQMLPQMIEAQIGVPAAELGITAVQVGGYKNYGVFLRFAQTLGIPVIQIEEKIKRFIDNNMKYKNFTFEYALLTTEGASSGVVKHFDYVLTLVDYF